MFTLRRERLLLWLSLGANVLLLLAFVGFLGKWKLMEVQLAHERRNGEELMLLQKEAQSAAKSRSAPQPALSDAEVLEHARLRNEVTRLRGEQRATPPKSAGNAIPATGAAQQSKVSTVESHTTTATANVYLGHTLSVGTWRSPATGKQLVGFLTPEIATQPGGGSSDSILVTARIMEFPNSLREQLGMQQMQNGAAFTPDQFRAFLQRAEQSDGVDVLSMPRIITLSGREAQVAISSRQPDGTVTGPVINVTPTLDATRTAVRMDYKFGFSRPANPAP